MHSTSSFNLIENLLQRGVEQHQNGAVTQALALYEQALALDPSQADALCLAGIAEFVMGNTAKGLSLARRATELHPDFVTGHIELATMLQMSGNTVEALNAYGNAFYSAGLTKSFHPPAVVLTDLIATVSKKNLGNWMNGAKDIMSFGELFARVSPESGLSPTGIDIALKFFDPTADEEEDANKRADVLLGLLGFAKTSPPSWTKCIFEQLALPWMKAALACQRYNMALKLETLIYEEYVKQTETERHFRECFVQWIEPMREAGHTAATNLPPLRWPTPHSKPTVGFFLHEASMLAHVGVMLSVLENLPHGINRPFLPRVYAFSGTHPELLARLARHEIPVTLMEQECHSNGNWFQRLICLRQHLAEDGVTALIWVTAALMMPFAFAMRLAPVQIWWAMKYHGQESTDIDGYITGGSLARYKNINGRLWRTANLGVSDWYDPTLSTKATEIRKRFAGCELILGTFGREEKLASQPFLQAIADILKSFPNAVFLWTGRTKLEYIQDTLNQLGVGKQCYFIGWVDTKIYAQVIDIFLDSFPFPCGFTAIQAMAAGKPIVLYASRESYGTGIHGMISPVLEDPINNREQTAQLEEIFSLNTQTPTYLCAKTPEEYVRYAKNLINSPQYRTQAGDASRTFVCRYLSNPSQAAQRYAAHILEIIEENRRLAAAETYKLER